MDLLIRNGRIIDPGQGIDKLGNVLVSGDTVSWVGEGKRPRQGHDVFDAEGLIVCPGFIDLHCHLRQPGYEAKETIATGTLAAARGGFTTVCCMPNTEPPLDNPLTISDVKSVAAREGVVRVLPIGCVSRGRRGEELTDMKALASAGVVAFSDDGAPVGNSRMMREALEHSLSLGLPVIDHCEDMSLTSGGQVNEGIMSSRLGLKGIAAAAEEIIVARDLALAALTGGRLHIAHVSTAGSVELIRNARAKGIKVTAEVTPHHLTLTEAAVGDGDTNAKVSPPLRSKQDVHALIKGLKDGVIDIIATDHAPHAEADKRCEFTLAAFGISGLETALGSVMSLVHDGRMTLFELVGKLTCGPAKILNNRKVGTLAVGSPADITIFDPEMEWTVDPAAFASKGKNTPLAGTKLSGKVVATIYRGKLVHADDPMKRESKERMLRGV